MAKFFMDTEFITGFKKPIPFLPTIGRWNKPEFFIHLVSIGIVDESGREYYAISNDFNPKLADKWVKENVLSKLPKRYVFFQSSSPREKEGARLWKPNQQIKMDIIEFMGGGIDSDQADYLYVPEDTEVYAYFADYDWVVFCSLFGRMIDLPAGMPMFCLDIKQMLDEYADNMPVEVCKEINQMVNPGSETNLLAGRWIISKKGRLEILKMHEDYPKQSNEHNALDDAKFNLELYKFLKSL